MSLEGCLEVLLGDLVCQVFLDRFYFSTQFFKLGLEQTLVLLVVSKSLNFIVYQLLNLGLGKLGMQSLFSLL